jgi:hypothetical protein
MNLSVSRELPNMWTFPLSIFFSFKIQKKKRVERREFLLSNVSWVAMVMVGERAMKCSVDTRIRFDVRFGWGEKR